MTTGWYDITTGQPTTVGAMSGIPLQSGDKTQLDEKIGQKVINMLLSRGVALPYLTNGDESFDAETRTVNFNDAGVYNVNSIPPYNFKKKYVDGKTVRQGDLITGVPGLNLEFIPVPGMRVIINEVIWNLQSVSPVYSGESIALYILHVRKVD